MVVFTFLATTTWIEISLFTQTAAAGRRFTGTVNRGENLLLSGCELRRKAASYSRKVR